MTYRNDMKKLVTFVIVTLLLVEYIPDMQAG